MPELTYAQYPRTFYLNERRSGLSGDLERQSGQNRGTPDAGYPPIVVATQLSEVRDRLIKIETRMASLASTENIATTRGDLLAAMTSQTWKMVTWTSLIGATIVGATFTLARLPQ